MRPTKEEKRILADTTQTCGECSGHPKKRMCPACRGSGSYSYALGNNTRFAYDSELWRWVDTMGK